MTSKKSVNPQTHDQRNERHHRDLASGAVFASQEEGQRAKGEKADGRRLAGGPGDAGKAASAQAQREAKAHGNSRYKGLNPS